MTLPRKKRLVQEALDSKNVLSQAMAERWLSLRTRLASDGSALVVVSDITSMKHSEEQLKLVAQEMRGLAYTGSLTGIANRRVFDDEILMEFARARRSRSPLSVLLMDIDHFKTYSPLGGHATVRPRGAFWRRRIRNRPAWDRQGWRDTPGRGPHCTSLRSHTEQATNHL